MGRWMSPDPYNGSIDPSNPQSFNRYSYVGNNPLGFTDPSGAVPCPAVPIPGEEIFFATCVGAVGGTAVCGPVCGAIAGGAALVGSVLADLFTGGFFAKPAFHGSLKPRPNTPNKGFLHSVVCDVASPFLKVASATNSTLGIGVGANAGAGFIFGIAGSGSSQIVADPQGNIGLALTSGGNPGYGVFGVGGMVGAQGSVSSASTIYDLSGWSTGFGGSFGPIGLDGATSGTATTLTSTLGAGVGTKGSALSANYTTVPKLTSTNCN